jgi:hypothetical protein
MDAGKPVFKLVLLKSDWYWDLDTMRDDVLIGPFSSREEAEKDAKETLGIGNAAEGLSDQTTKEEGRAQMPVHVGYAYIVDADHADEKYRAEVKPVVVRREEGGFSASAFPYGCGVGAPTPEQAIRLLLEGSGCSNVRIVYCPKTDWD